MKKNRHLTNYQEIERQLLNEISDMNTIYDYSIQGPQEEEVLQPYKINLDKFYQFLEKEKLNKKKKRDK